MKFYYYKITNIKNGSFYIGITTQPKERQHNHFYQLKKGIHHNWKLQNDYNIYGVDSFVFEIIEEKDFDFEEQGYQYEYELIQKNNATQSYNIAEGGHLNPVYSPQVIEKIRQTQQDKYDNILQYKFENNQFVLVGTYGGIRDAVRQTKADFRAIQNCTKTAQAHHDYYWVKEGEKEKWLETFLKRYKCCVAKINKETNEIEDTALTIQEFADKYETTYQKIYSSIRYNNCCDRIRKLKFIRITANEFANINNLSL